MSVAPSLFDPPPQPVMEQAGSWIVALLTGSLATTLCIVAVAVLGLALMGGRMQLRAGLQTIIGCFLLLGTALIAGDLAALARETGTPEPTSLAITPDPEPEAPLPPANYDPYAGASVPRD